MNPLYLSGFGVSLRVDRARLIVNDGYSLEGEREEYQFHPHNLPYDSIVIDGHSGNISLTAIKWLMRHKTPLFILDYNGSLLSSILPKEPVSGHLKKAQLETYQNKQKRLTIAKKLLEAKFKRSQDIIECLNTRYDGLDLHLQKMKKESSKLDRLSSLQSLLMLEGRVAEIYWKAFQLIIPKKFHFISRMRESHQTNSSDQVNTLLNYGYAFLESRCRAAINAVGLEPSIGFLHEIAQPKHPLVYDLQEPFRWIIDKTVISCIENEKFKKKDFFLTDNYVLRLQPQAINKLLEELRVYFNSRIKYKETNYTWNTIIQLKMKELTRYIFSKNKEIDFINPSPKLKNVDNKELRDKILSLNPIEARKIGINKSTFWYLQKRANLKKPLHIYKNVKNKIK